jgi:hypothetical protein
LTAIVIDSNDSFFAQQVSIFLLFLPSIVASTCFFQLEIITPSFYEFLLDALAKAVFVFPMLLFPKL